MHPLYLSQQMAQAQTRTAATAQKIAKKLKLPSETADALTVTGRDKSIVVLRTAEATADFLDAVLAALSKKANE